MKVRNTLLAAAFTIALSLGTTGCGPKAVTDQALATDIQAKLYADPDARSANVKVNVANGVVTLSGDAPTSDIALKVVNIANGTSGIKSVDNQLKIAGPAATTAATLPPVTPAPAATNALASNSSKNRQLPPPTPPVRDNPPPMTPMEHSAPAMRHEEPPKPVTATVPAGTNIAVSMIDSISSKSNTSGQTFRGSLSSPIVIEGRSVLPAGSGATVLLSNAKGATRIKGNSELEVRLIKIEHAGHTYDVDTSVHDEVGKGRGKQTAIRTGIGAAAGAVIGAIAGGGKGAAIGSLAGGGAGAGFQLATHGQQVTIPSESILTFSLQSPIVVTLRGSARDDSERDRQ